jgi:beta-lactamase class A
MVESDSPPRLRAMLPTNINVAHKYGTSGGESESDCGIVYIPKRPYIICMMVSTDPEQANKIIQEVSKKVYDYVSNK